MITYFLIILLILFVLIKETIKWFKVGKTLGFISLFGNFILFIMISYILVIPFVVIDNNNGMIEGKINGVEKNFGGTYTIYIKTDKNEKYCIEDKGIAEFAKKLEGRKAIIGKGTREGIYGITKCHEAPIIHIERAEDVQSDNKN